MTYCPFTDIRRFATASDDQYLRYIRCYLKKGGVLKPEMLVHDENVPQIYFITSTDQRDIPRIQYDRTTYFLFDMGEDILFDRKASPAIREHVKILSCKNPLNFAPPPYVTKSLVNHLTDGGEYSLKDLFFDDEFYDYFLALECLGSKRENDNAGDRFIDDLINCTSPDDLQKILEKNRSDGSTSAYNKVRQIEGNFFKNHRSSTPLYFSSIARDNRNKALRKLDVKLAKFNKARREILAWKPLKITPPKPAHDKSFEELIMRQRLVREAALNRRFK